MAGDHITNIEFKPLADKIPRGFCCGVEDIDIWACKRAHQYHADHRSRVTTAHIPDREGVIGFYSLRLTAQSEDLLHKRSFLRLHSSNRMFASLQIEFFAVARAFQGRRVARKMMGRVMEDAHEIIGKTGLTALTLTPLNAGLRPFYEELGFKAYGEASGQLHMMLPAATVVKLITGE